MKHYEAVIIGGGSAGLAAACKLKENGVENIVVLEKESEPGGILEQCIHNGFGLQTFKEQLAGPAYAERFATKAKELGVEIKLDTMVMSLSDDKVVEYVNEHEGYVKVSADVVILCVGCYERHRGAVEIAGERPAGIYTAGQAQRYLNIDGFRVGKKVFILGSGDIGLIMARRMTLEGAEVLGVAELMPYSNGLPRNIKQCLTDFDIPLYLSHTVTKVFGHDRLERIEVSEVDEHFKPVPGSQMYFDVDTLLLSTGLIPENHLAEEAGIVMNKRTRGPIVDENYMTSIEGIFACGNGLHVHDLVDFVSLEGTRAADGACRYLEGKARKENGRSINTVAGDNVGYVVPGIIYPETITHHVEFFFRVRKPMEKGTVQAVCNGEVLRKMKRTKLLPSEMERLILTKDQLSKLDGDLVIEVIEEGE